MGQASSLPEEAQPSPSPLRLTREALKALQPEEEERESGSDEERESFASWRSTSGAPPGRRSSADTLSPMSQAGDVLAQQWGRQSADTPLPAGSGPAVPKPSSSRRSCSQELQRGSGDSGPAGLEGGSVGGADDRSSSSSFSAAGSVRSSFALEHASVEANRASLERFHEAFFSKPLVPPAPPPQQPSPPVTPTAAPVATLQQLADAAQLPPSLREKFARLAVIPPNTPAPASMLAKLWQADAADVKTSLAAMAAKGVLNVAQLPDGRVWCLPQAQQLALVTVAARDAAPAYHRQLLDAYCASLLPSISEEGGADALAAMGAGLGGLGLGGLQRGGSGGGGALPQQAGPAAASLSAAGLLSQLAPAQRLRDLPDDGYILINLGHHLTAAGWHAQLRELLLDPDWLRRKLVAAGTTAVVADFRRYLLLDNCADVKLVLEAFQLSAAQAVAYPRSPGLLRCLMAGRLATAPLSPALAAWLAEQRRRVYEDGRAALLAGLPRCLPPLTPSLDQAGGLQRLVLRGHGGPVTRVLLTPSGTDVVTASADGTARVWDLDIGDCVLLLEGHAGPLTDIAITSDGSLLLTCSTDGTARAFEMERGSCLRVLAGHTAAINGLAMDPWARFVVTASADGTGRVWDLSSARSIHVLRTGCTPEQGGALCVALSPCTRFAIVGCANSMARMYDVISGQCMGVMAAHTNWVNLARFLPDGKKAVTASHDGTVRVWDLHTGQCRHVLSGHTGKINGITISEDGRWAATASEDGSVRVWDLRRGRCRRVLQGHKAWVSSVAASPAANNRLVTASGDGTALAYSAESGDLLCLLEGHSGPVLDAVVTRKGRFAVTVSEDATVRVWDFAARHVAPPSYHEGRVYCMAGSGPGRVLATCGEDCDARLWDTQRGTFKGLLQRHKVPIRWAAFSADGRQLVTASPDRCVLLWDVAGLSVLRAVPVPEGSRLRSFAASADLARAVICKWDSTVLVVDLQTGAQLCVLQKWGERDSATGHTSAVNQVLMTQDGATVVTLSKDGTARVWDAATGDCRHVLTGHLDSVLGGCLSDPARLLATYAFDDCVRLWALDSGQCLSCIRLPATATHVALSPDGWKCAAALANAAVVVFDVEDKAAGPLWEFHGAEVTGLQFSADGAELMTCSLDASVCVWDAATGTPTGLFVGDCGFTCCWYDDSLEQLAVGTDRGIVHALDLGLLPRPLAGATLLHPAAAAKAAAHPTAGGHPAGAAAGASAAAQHAHAGPHPRTSAQWEPGHGLPLQAPEPCSCGEETCAQAAADGAAGYVPAGLPDALAAAATAPAAAAATADDAPESPPAHKRAMTGPDDA